MTSLKYQEGQNNTKPLSLPNLAVKFECFDPLKRERVKTLIVFAVGTPDLGSTPLQSKRPDGPVHNAERDHGNGDHQPDQEAKLALAGAKGRLDLATKLYLDFITEYCNIVESGAIYRPSTNLRCAPTSIANATSWRSNWMPRAGLITSVCARTRKLTHGHGDRRSTANE